MALWAVLDDQQCLLIVLDDTDPCCSSGWDPPCGGCTACLFAQANYSNCTVIPVPIDGIHFETFSDALGTIMAGTNIPGRIPALQTCIDRKWGPGQVLTSKSWKTDRKLSGALQLDPKDKIPNQAVRVTLLTSEGIGVREEYLYTFPEDVAPVTPSTT